MRVRPGSRMLASFAVVAVAAPMVRAALVTGSGWPLAEVLVLAMLPWLGLYGLDGPALLPPRRAWAWSLGLVAAVTSLAAWAGTTQLGHPEASRPLLPVLMAAAGVLTFAAPVRWPVAASVLAMAAYVAWRTPAALLPLAVALAAPVAVASVAPPASRPAATRDGAGASQKP